MPASRPTTTRRRTARRGFSLIELMAVLLLLGILGGIAVLGIPAILKGGREDATKASMKVVATALEAYSLRNNNTYPESLQVLVDQQLVTKQSAIMDAWKRPILYYAPSVDPETQQSVSFLLLSYGANGMEDGYPGTNTSSDDIYYLPNRDTD